MKLKEAILNIVNAGGGGVKFMTLITELACMNAEKGLEQFYPYSDFVQIVEETCKNMNEIKLLSYVMKMGDMDRLKMFVYFPDK